MRHRFSSVVILLAASLSISAEAPYIPTDFSGTDPDGLVVHEWGTFTSVAAEDGTAVDWVPQQGPRDLPCFVDRVHYNSKDGCRPLSGWKRRSSTSTRQTRRQWTSACGSREASSPSGIRVPRSHPPGSS